MMTNKKQTILLYGRTNAGKTAQVGEMAIYVHKTTGKRTRLYTADKGGIETVRAHVDLGLIEVIEIGDTDPFLFLNKAAKGYVRDANGKWVMGDLSNIGMVVFESMTAFAELIMAALIKKASDGTSIGGSGNVNFQVTAEGETLKVSGSNMSMFGVAQSRLTDEIWASQKIDVPFIMWTASASKDEDQTAGGKVIGPAMIGKALTAEIPRWFDKTFRIDCLPAAQGKPERHILYLGNSTDMQAGNATGLGNTRSPLDGTTLPTSIEPASLVKALELIDGGYNSAMEAIKKRIGQIGSPTKL